MRLGLAIGVGSPTTSDPVAAAALAEEAGLDLVLLEGNPASPADALTTAAFLSGTTNAVRVVALVHVGGHPLHIAEQAAVADNALQGRLSLALCADGGDPSLLAESTEVVLAASAPRPFRFEGRHWTIPGGVEGNVTERRISVTPKPAQPELPVWVSGPQAGDVAAELGVSYLARPVDGPSQAASTWHAVEQSLRRAVVRMRRPAVRELDCTSSGSFDHSAVVEALVAEQALWGLDVAILRLPRALGARERRRAVQRVARFVRPPLQMDRIPAHVQEYWQRELAGRVDGGT
jgi:alkanesulfonate monooxygenase SsuD/methylene tetrahydromethanopterin reductase-like flavin-dependent oxidoreductase (luciferase family)